MHTVSLEIGGVPALLSGEESDKVFLFVHGLGGNKEESLAFSQVAVPKGYQVLGIDIPLDKNPWEVLPLMDRVRDYLFSRWGSVSLRANSIGCWYSLLSFQGRDLSIALFVSPILDMKKYIETLPSRDDDYYDWVVKHPVEKWNVPTFVLRPDKDLAVGEECVREFISLHGCRLTVMEGGEHWFHTPSQLSFMKKWEEESLEEVSFAVTELGKDSMGEALELVKEVFLVYEAPSYGKEGTAEFLKSIGDNSYLDRHRFFAILEDGNMAGVIAAREALSHIGLLFVRGDCQGKGIGAMLVRHVLGLGCNSTVTVNSSPSAHGFYRKMGFRDTAGEQNVNGLRFYPMAWEREDENR